MTEPPPRGRRESHRRLSRRALLHTGLLGAAGAAGLVLVGCGGDDAAAPVPAGLPPDPAAEAASRAAPASAATPPIQVGPADDSRGLETDPLIYVRPRRVMQGDAFLVAVDAPGAGFASAAFGGQVFTLLREGSRFFAVLPVEARTAPGPLPVVISVADGQGQVADSRETLIDVTAASFPIDNVQLDAANAALLDPAVLQEDHAIRQAVQRRVTPERHWDGLFDPPTVGVITSAFGELRSYNYQEPTEYHTGVDFAGEDGDPVLAPNAGVVAYVGQTQRRGNLLMVDHGSGLFSGYYHLSEVLVQEGQVVNRGDAIARIGATGLATGPHLHWEIVVHNVPVNPLQWIRELEVPDPTATFDPAEALPPSGGVASVSR